VWQNITIDPKIFTEKEPLYSMLSSYQSFKVILEDISKPVEFSCMFYSLEKHKELKGLEEKISNGFLYKGGILCCPV
jgi:hypothetical protein